MISTSRGVATVDSSSRRKSSVKDAINCFETLLVAQREQTRLGAGFKEVAICLYGVMTVCLVLCHLIDTRQHDADPELRNRGQLASTKVRAMPKGHYPWVRVRVAS